MRTPILILIILAGAAAVGTAQRPRNPITGRVKGALKGAVDSVATRTAAAVADSALGTGATRLGLANCPAGTMPAAAPTVGTAAVGKLKQLLKDAADAAPSAQPPECVPDVAASGQPALTAGAALRAQQAAEAEAAQAATPGASAAIGAMVAATPVGLAVGAAPVAAKGVKAIGGLFGKGQTRESMIEDLSDGRLELKAVRFIGGSDALKNDVEETFAALAEALQALEGDFVLNLPPETDGKSAPDSVMARRRLAKLSEHLAMAGIGERLALRSEAPGLDSTRKLPKIGEARAEVVRSERP